MSCRGKLRYTTECADVSRSFHDVTAARYALPMRPDEILALALQEQERARGVVAGLGPCALTLSRATTRLGSFTVDLRTGQRAIRISRYLTEADQVRDTARHELAHQAAYDFHSHLGHGPLWKTWAQYLDCAPVACSGDGVNPDVARARQRYALSCGRCGWTITRQRRSRLIEHSRRYACARCRGPLVLSELIRRPHADDVTAD
jgi:predicted SprT family Zn-dependent metalloprotease